MADISVPASKKPCWSISIEDAPQLVKEK